MDWNQMAAPWLRAEAETDAAHAPVLEAILARAALGTGQKVLDIGPGAGVSLLRAVEAVGPTGHVTGLEIAPPFADRARDRVSGPVDIITADAGTHAYAPKSFDAAISLFGVMFFADPVAAFANIRGALKPGAALTFGCWGAPPDNPWFSAPARVASEVFGTKPPPFDPDAPGPMAFGDTAKISRILGAAGWKLDIDTQDLHLTPMGSPEDVAALQMTIGTAAMRMRVAKEEGTLTEAHKDALRAGLADVFRAMTTPDGIRVPARVHIVQALA